MSTPKVSVIVPVFNVKPYLCECLDSILAQTLSDLEIICGDGGSTDGSLDIIRDYAMKYPRIRYITKEGSGYGQSVNECLNMAKGEYIGIVESDDTVEPNTYEVLYGLAIKNNLDWIRGDIYYYYSGMPKEKQLKRESIIYGGDFYNTILNPQTDYRPYKSGLRTWSGIYKTSFLRDNGIQHNETPGGSYQDVGFYLKTLYYAKRVYFVDQAFYKWRQDNPGSSVHYNSTKLMEKSFREWDLNRQYLDKHPNIGRRAYASYNYRKFYSYLWTIDMVSGDEDDKLVAQRKAAKEFTEAMAHGEIDRGFFDEWEWERFLNTLHDWQVISGIVLPKQDIAEISIPNHPFKRFLKRILHPLAHLCKKITYKLMSGVIFTIENDISSLRLCVNETAEGTQWQVRESAAELKRILQEISSFDAQLYEEITRNRVFCEQRLELLSGQLEAMKDSEAAIWQKLIEQGEILWGVKTRSEDIHDKAALTQQKVLDQGELLWGVKCRCEDIHDKAALTQQKVLDQGELLWTVRCRAEDIHKRTEETGQRVCGQGDVLWGVHSRLIDVEKRVYDGINTILWNSYYDKNKDNVQKLVSVSPLYDIAFFWNNQYASINSAQCVLSVVFNLVAHKSIVDFGCGTGTWLWVAQTLGVSEVLGIDGKYVPDDLLMISKDCFVAADLEQPVILDKKYELAISMEVAEHLNEKSADTFVKSLCDSADTILFSAAHPGQGGDGHINEQPVEYWVEKFNHFGFKEYQIRHLFIDNYKIERWYRDNVVLFSKRDDMSL